MIFWWLSRGGSTARSRSGGFGLIDTLVGVFVFAIIAVGIYQTYAAVQNLSRLARLNVTAVALANEQLEIARNLPYADVGIQGGIPPGKIPRVQTLTRGGAQLQVTTTVRNIDDPFDGTIGGVPNDTAPADYKLVEVAVACPTCRNVRTLTATTQVAPRALESQTSNGALFIQALDANGQPVQSAAVHVENNQANPRIVVDDTTNANGILQLVDVPPGAEAYEITVTKSGYSTDQTYARTPQNPNPTKPHATVVQGTVTQVTFAIDRLSTLNVASVRDTCQAVDSVDFTMQGAKLIGTSPDVPKYSQSHTTDANGQRAIGNLEWDTYSITLTSTTYDLLGSIPLLPLALSPNTTQDLQLVVAPKESRSVLVTVKDAGTQLPLSNAAVTLSRTGFSSTLTTGRGFLRQTDWIGGSGQTTVGDPTRYFQDDGNIDLDPPGPGRGGEIALTKTGSRYASSGWLESSTFDSGSESNFHNILWQPQDQPPETGQDSMRFQIATSKNPNAAWVYVGPDGTGNTYYTLSNTAVHERHQKDRYFRYKAFLRTADTQYTPSLAEVAVTFTSSCVPPGQVLFTGLAAGDYTITVTRSGYQTATDEVTVSADWQQKEIRLSPSPS